MSFFQGLWVGSCATNMNAQASQSLAYLKSIINNSVGALFDRETPKVTKVALVIIFSLFSPLLLACAITCVILIVTLILVTLILMPVLLLFLYKIALVSIIRTNCLP